MLFKFYKKAVTVYKKAVIMVSKNKESTTV